LYRIHGELTAMYESGGTRWYRYGRTDTIRNTTSQAHSFPQASVRGGLWHMLHALIVLYFTLMDVCTGNYESLVAYYRQCTSDSITFNPFDANLILRKFN